MSDIQLFRLTLRSAQEPFGRIAAAEKRLHSLIEAQMQTLLGTCVLAREYDIGKTYKGHFELPGLDE